MGWLLALLVTAAVVKAAADWQFAGPTSTRRRKLQLRSGGAASYTFCVDFFEFDGYRGGWTNCTLSNCECARSAATAASMPPASAARCLQAQAA